MLPRVRHSGHRGTSGFAMATVLVLILVMAMLGTAGVHHALLGRTLAITRALHQRAFALAELGAASAAAEIRANQSAVAATRQLRPLPSPTDSAIVTTRLVGSNALPRGFSAGRFVESHLEISSTGLTARNARVVIVLGFKRVSPVAAAAALP